MEHWVSFVSDFFDTDHNAVVVLVDLGGLLDANKDQWKFKIKDIDSIGWSHFRDCSSSRILVIKNRFLVTAVNHDLEAMWSLLEGALVGSVDECSKNKRSSKFLGLKLLIAKIVKKLESDDAFGFNCFVRIWSTLDADKALMLRKMYLSIVRKKYRKSKMYELKLVQKASIRAAIEKCMEKFCLDKSSMIRSVLDRPFQKVVLDHLVVDDELVLDPEGVRLNVDRIIETYQYVPLNYVWDDAFSSVMNVISMGKLLLVVGGLPDGKATGLSGIPNELWKHSGEKIMPFGTIE
ncbi:hypothetical protein G9A89_003942 [Geosiphon pyriformis]|nr:hypothetical protein G9A89_003942 [Geosiphon pyriformis]